MAAKQSIKTCRDCGVVKPLSEFYASRGLYYNPRCKECDKRASKAWRIANPERVRELNRKYPWKERHLRNKYRMSEAEWDRLFTMQSGLCAICKSPPGASLRSGFHVDHNHSTLKVRGLLCGSCNRAIGLFKDSADIMRSAARYLDIAEKKS